MGTVLHAQGKSFLQKPDVGRGEAVRIPVVGLLARMWLEKLVGLLKNETEKGTLEPDLSVTNKPRVREDEASAGVSAER